MTNASILEFVFFDQLRCCIESHSNTGAIVFDFFDVNGGKAILRDFGLVISAFLIIVVA